MSARTALARLTAALRREQRGVSAVEFGLLAPAFFTILLGTLDVAHETYARSVFVGAVERAARDASLETGDPAAVDALVRSNVLTVMPDIKLVTTRRSFYDFADIAKPENFTDDKGKNASGQWNPDPGRGNGKCDYGEPFEDFNRNGKWDSDTTKSGASNNGSASDVVMYTVTATYSPLFKIPFAPDLWNKRTMTATAIKKNQPFAQQNAVAAGTCP